MKTKFRQQKEKHDQQVYDRYQELISQPGAMPTAVERRVMREHNIHSRSTVYQTCKRVEQRLGGDTSGVQPKI